MMEDDYIIDLAKKISSSDQRLHSEIVRDISNYFESLDDAEEVHIATTTIWNINILPIMLLEMKKDFSHFQPNSWTDGVCLVRAVHDVLIQFVPKDRSEEDVLQRRFFPEFLDNLLCFYRQLQDNYNQSTVPDYRGISSAKNLIQQMKTVLDMFQGFLNKFPEFVKCVLESPWFLQVFIADSEETCIMSADLLTELVNLRPEVVKQVGRVVIKGIGNVVSTIIDELVYHISVTDNERLVDSDLRCLLHILEADKSLISILNHRYRGLKLIIRKWSLTSVTASKASLLKNFPPNLNKLIRILDTGIIDLNQAQWAVVKIQSWWKSVSLRMKLTRTNKAFAEFQKSFRQRKTKERDEQNIERIRKELRFQIIMTRQKKFREKLEAEVLLMETLPAPIVLRHLEKTRQEAATKIQAQWRGRQEKARLYARKEVYRKTKAAVTIQRHVRAWSSRRDFVQEKEKLNTDVNVCLWRVPGLTAERKSELMREYNKWFLVHKYKFKGLSEEEQLKIHFEALHAKRRHFRGLQQSRREDLCREATLARIDNDCKLLLSAPSLRESLEEGGAGSTVDQFHCKIRPLANRAAQLHLHQINKIKLPWWKQLLIEEPSDLDADDDLLAYVGDLRQYTILGHDFEMAAEGDPCDTF